MEKLVSSLFNGLEKPNFALGTSQIASLGRRIPYSETLKLFKSAFSNNIKIIDTADSYGSGDSECLIGKVLREINSEPFIITKAGFPYASFPYLFSPLNQIAKKVKQKLGAKKNFSPDYIVSSLKKSLKRLNRKKLGAFLLHELTDEDISSGECWEALKEVRKTGLSFLTGISSNEPDVVSTGLMTGEVEIVETRVQVNDENSRKIALLCREKSIPVIANEVLRPFQYDLYNLEEIMNQIKLMQGLENIKPMQLLIAVTYFNFDVDCIVFGTRNPGHLIDNIRSTEFFPAVEKNLAQINKLVNDNRKT